MQSVMGNANKLVKYLKAYAKLNCTYNDGVCYFNDFNHGEMFIRDTDACNFISNQNISFSNIEIIKSNIYEPLVNSINNETLLNFARAFNTFNLQNCPINTVDHYLDCKTMPILSSVRRYKRTLMKMLSEDYPLGDKTFND